jgi:hypothetical protein
LALIELSTEPLAAAPAPPPAHTYRVMGLALVVVLVLGLAGGVPTDAVRWQHAGMIALPSDADYQVAGSRVFTLEIVDGKRVTSAWMTRPLRRLWRTMTTAEDSAGGLVQGGSSVSVAGNYVLLRSGQSTSVLNARTGAVLWTSELPLTAVSDTVAMSQDTQFRPGTEYDESSGAPGALFFGSNGRPHTEPPQRTDVIGFDLATGRAKWTAPYRGSIFPAVADGIPGAVIVVAAGELTLRSASDGSVLRSQRIPVTPGGGSAWGEVVGDLVLVRQGGLVTAYTMADLHRRWQRTDPDSAGNSATCTGLTCEKDGRTVLVLDPATGTPRWRTDGEVDLRAGAGYVIETQTGQNKPLRAADPGSGAVQVDLSGWQSLVRAGGTVLVSRRDTGRTTDFGLLMPGRRVVQTIGATRSPVTDCLADSRMAACRTLAGVEIFTYSAQ